MTGVKATLNITCFLAFKRLQTALKKNIVETVVQLCKSSIHFLHFFVANTPLVFSIVFFG